MSDKKIYMKIDDDEKLKSTLNEKLKDEIKEQPFEMALESALREISMKSVNGIVNIAIPEPTWQLISSILTKLLFNNEKEQEIQEMEMRR